MKTKTQIKRKAKRMISLLLTAMLLISTMVVGISTVSAAEDTLQPTTTPVANGFYRVFVTDNKPFNSAPCIHYWGGSSATIWDSRPTMNKLNGTNAQNQSVYWYDVPSNSKGIIFQHPNEKQSVDLMVGSDTKLKFQNGAGYCISGDKDGKYLYSYWDASSLLPSNAVASSVALSASNTQINPNDTVTLTATLTGKAVSDVTLTLTGGGTTQTKKVTGSDTTATFTVTPSAETTYKVVASAEGCNPVESAAVTVHIVGSKTFYLFYSDYTDNRDNPKDWPSNNKILMTNENGKYVGVINGVAKSNNYFAINDNDSLSADKQLWTRDTMNKIELTNESQYIEKNSFDKKLYDNIVNFYYHASSSASSIKIIFDGENAITLADVGSTPVENVKIDVPPVDNATVTAASDTAKAAEGGSLTVAKDSTFTVTVKPDKDYELASITYNGVTKTASPATFTASVSGGITVKLNRKETPTEPSTKPSTEPSTKPSTEPTTAPTGNVWYLKGDFNTWGETYPLTGSDNSLTTNVYIDSSKAQEFKVWNKTENKYYGNELSGGSVATEIKDYKLYQKDDPSMVLNVKFKPTESGIYKFTFDPTTLTLNAELVQSGLNAEVSAPESVKAGETFSITAKAIHDSTITPASYKFTIKIGDTVVVKDAVSTTAQYTYNKATISAPAYASAYVEAFDASGNIIGASSTVECEHQTIVTYDELTVKLSADGSEVVAGTDVTLTAAATPASYVSSYDFLISKSYDFKGTDLVTKTSSSSTLKYKFDTVGTYYVKVVAHNKYGQNTNTADATSNIIEISVVETSGEHEVTFYFKAPSAFAYFPKMTLDGADLAVTKDAELGASFTGSVTFYWYKATATVNSSNTHTLSVSTRRTSASGSMTGNFYGSKYWLAIDNLMSGKTLANLTSLQPYIRNYYHSPLHTVYAGVADDGTLGFTNINGKRYAMGTYSDGDPSTANATLSIKAATAAQKAVAKLDTYSEVQTCLLDVNLDGRVDVLDATMIQRALVNIL